LRDPRIFAKKYLLAEHIKESTISIFSKQRRLSFMLVGIHWHPHSQIIDY